MVFEIADIAVLQREAERFCRFLIERQVSENGVFNSRLVFNELVGNVLKHAQGVATVHSEVKDGFVEVRVYSTKRFVPPKTSSLASVTSEHGRGLFLVDSVCVERITTEDGGIAVRIKIR